MDGNNMDTADKCAKNNIETIINNYSEDIVPIIYIKEQIGSSYKSIIRILKDIGYNVKKRNVMIERSVFTINKGDIVADRK